MPPPPLPHCEGRTGPALASSIPGVSANLFLYFVNSRLLQPDEIQNFLFAVDEARDALLEALETQPDAMSRPSHVGIADGKLIVEGTHICIEGGSFLQLIFNLRSTGIFLVSWHSVITTIGFKN